MRHDILSEVRTLLVGERVLSLGVLRNERPYVGLLPYVAAPDFTAAFIHASRLALHSAGLEDGAPFAVLIHEADRPGGDALQMRRLTLQGTVSRIPRDSRDYAVVRQTYTARFPESSTTFELGDFSLYRLEFEEGRYVGGFARARSLGRRDIEGLADLADPKGTTN